MRLLPDKHGEEIDPSHPWQSAASGKHRNSNETQGLGENSSGLWVQSNTQRMYSRTGLSEGQGSGCQSMVHSHHPPPEVLLLYQKISLTKKNPNLLRQTAFQKINFIIMPILPEQSSLNTLYVSCILANLKELKTFFGFIVKIYFILFWLPRQAFRWKPVHNTTVFRNEKSETTLTPSVHKKTQHKKFYMDLFCILVRYLSAFHKKVSRESDRFIFSLPLIFAEYGSRLQPIMSIPN